MVFVQEIIQIKHGTHVINLDKYKWIWAHWIAFYVNGFNINYFDSFGAEHIPR